MSQNRLNIVVHDEFATELSGALTVPHDLKTIQKQSDPEIADLLAETDVLVSGSFKADWRNGHKSNRPRFVHSVGAGVDDIDFANLPAGCVVSNVYGHEKGVAEQAFMLMFSLHRGLLQLDAGLRKGDWTPQPVYLPEMTNRNLLILGLGHIGAELVRWGHFLKMNVVALTRNPSSKRAEEVGLSTLGKLDQIASHLPDADFVVVAIPNAVGTVDLIGEKEFQMMKRSAYLINVGRAPVVNEQALYQALKSRRIAGAGLDVWYRYPDTADQILHPASFPFHELDNVIMTPHKPTIETMLYRWNRIAENIARFSRNEPLFNVVHPA